MSIPHSSLDQSDLEWVAQRCGKAKRLDVNKWVCLCPAHADHTPSLSVSLGRKGQILLYCHAGCSYDSVLDDRLCFSDKLFDTFKARFLILNRGRHGIKS